MNDNAVRLPLHEVHFSPLKAFNHDHASGAVSSYVPGLYYSVKPGDEDLLHRVMQWEANGLVSIGERPMARTKATLRVL